MKISLIITLLLSLAILSGCVGASAAQPEVVQRPAETVLSDVMPAASPAPATPESAPAQAPAKPEDVHRLSKDEAIAIALNDAGLSKDQVTRLKAEFDYDDGRPEYDVEFKHGGWEYEYEIHAETGEILSGHRELDD